MRCSTCGADNPDGAVLCKSCGSPLMSSASYVAPVSTPTDKPADSQEQPAVNEEKKAYSGRKESMGWHRFLCWFALWAAAVANAFFGYQRVTDTFYGEDTALYFERIPGLAATEHVFGVALFLIAAFCAFTAYSLLRMKKAAPKMLYLYHGILIGSTLIYSMALFFIISPLVSSVGDKLSFIWETVKGLFYTVIGFIINYIYYGKREYLFQN